MRRKNFIKGSVLILLIVGLLTMPISCNAASNTGNSLKSAGATIAANEPKIAELTDMLTATHELANTLRNYGFGDDTYEITNLKNNYMMLYERREKLIEETESLRTYKYNTELEILSRVVYAEAGSDGISDECQQLVAMVVLNRVNDRRYPDNIYDVVFQRGQYACTWDGGYYKTPNQRAINNAKKALDGEVYCPPKVLGQAGFVSGRIYKTFRTPWSTVYFCYID